MMPLIEKLARTYLSSNPEKIFDRYCKSVKHIEEFAKEKFPKEKLDFVYHMHDKNILFSYLKLASKRNYIVSKTLLEEIKKKKYTYNLKNTKTDELEATTLTLPIKIKTRHLDAYEREIEELANDVIFIYKKQGEYFQYKIFVMQCMGYDQTLVVSPILIAENDYRSEFVSQETVDLILRTVHYIQHLGNPDLRKGINAEKLNNAKKARKIARQEEYFFDHEVVTLGFAKDRKFSKSEWINSEHIRMQPYGPRENPEYKPILIPAKIKHRKKHLLKD